jgi:hypothetical protein
MVVREAMEVAWTAHGRSSGGKPHCSELDGDDRAPLWYIKEMCVEKINV